MAIEGHCKCSVCLRMFQSVTLRQSLASIPTSQLFVLRQVNTVSPVAAQSLASLPSLSSVGAGV